MSKDTFKEFVKKNPRLISFVKNNEMSWQKFYEMYDLYGEDENTWKNYIEPKEKEESIKEATSLAGLGGLMSWLKTIDLDNVQQGIGNIQRVLGVFQDFNKKGSTVETKKDEYKPRPLYKHFED